MNSIIQNDVYRCFLCGRNGAHDKLDVHHVYAGRANRKKSEAYGLTVRLCHNKCHIFGSNAVHNNAAVMNELHQIGQRAAMDYYGWTVDDFRRRFGKNYL